MTLPAGQLAFPTAQNASANANTLDDYEEGTFTPIVMFGGASVGVTYGTQLGRYTKIGRQVTISIQIVLTSKGSSTGAAQISGLPFTSVNDGNLASCAVGYAASFSSVTGSVLGAVQANNTRINLYQSANGAATALSNSNLTNTTNLNLSATYDAA